MTKIYSLILVSKSFRYMVYSYIHDLQNLQNGVPLSNASM